MSKLTKKGYFVKKKADNIKLIEEIRNELTVSPNNYYTGTVKQEKIMFEVFQEDEKYLQIPKYYGLNKLGPPKKNKEKEGKPVKLKFKGKLRDYQQEIVKKSIDYMTEKDGGLISLGCGQGKCLAKNTNIIMFDGTFKKVQDVIVGDKLMGDDGNCRNVFSITSGFEEMFLIKQDNGIDYSVNKSHILSLIDCNDNIIDIPLVDYLELSEEDKRKLYGFRTTLEYRFTMVPRENLETYITNLDLIDYTVVRSSIRFRKDIITLLLMRYGSVIPIHFRKDTLERLRTIINSVGYNSIIEDNNLRIIFNYDSTNEFSKSNITVESLGEGEYFGFTIDRNRRFLLEDMTVTHNTVIALNLACHFKVKTLVIVHKTFLLNQWLERIKQFTNASVGIIQQNKVETDNMIVVGMLQSIAKDKYPSKTFKDFGLVIFDEAHHAPSQYFSQALPIIACKKTLALSATPKRSDGLERILNWYFGDMIYQSNRVNNKDVMVSLMDYTIKDKDFKECKLPFNGKVNKPKTLSKIIKIQKRNDFIMDILKNLYKNKLRQILILSDRIEHLKILEDMILNFCPDYSYGYYIGAMKQDKLDESATKRIILASYGMAAEALDIPSLNTLIMATPRSNVEQSIGRIIRKKNEKVKPLIIDIIDNLTSFVNQSKNRIKLYRKKDYYIEKKVYIENELKETKDMSNVKISQISNTFDSNTIDFV